MNANLYNSERHKTYYLTTRKKKCIFIIALPLPQQSFRLMNCARETLTFFFSSRPTQSHCYITKKILQTLLTNSTQTIFDIKKSGGPMHALNIYYGSGLVMYVKTCSTGIIHEWGSDCISNRPPFTIKKLIGPAHHNCTCTFRYVTNILHFGEKVLFFQRL